MVDKVKDGLSGLPDIGEITPPLTDSQIKSKYDREYDVAHLQTQVIAAMYGIIAHDPKLKHAGQQAADMSLGMGHSEEAGFMQHPLLKSSAEFSANDSEVNADPDLSEGAKEELKNRKEKKMQARLAKQQGFNPTPGTG